MHNVPGKYRLYTFILIFVCLFMALGTLFMFLAQSSPEENFASNSLNTPDKDSIVKIVKQEKENENLKLLPQKIIYDVPFIAQAPLGNWDDAKQGYGCEEASLLMAMTWIKNQPLTAEEAIEEIINMADFQLDNYGNYHDTSISDTYKLLKEYFNFNNAFVMFDINVEDIKRELARGNLVIIPINGTLVNNPYYTPPGPFQHQILVVGYDNEQQELIVHDPGTKNGKFYRYPYQIINNAIMDYETGFNEVILERRTAMLVIESIESKEYNYLFSEYKTINLE